MIEPSSPFSATRIKEDFHQIDKIQELLSTLHIPFDQPVMEALQKLVDTVGSREFLPLSSALSAHLYKLKWAREGMFDTGYIIPWMAVYSSLNSPNSQLCSIATAWNSPHSSKDFVGKPVNTFGSLSRPVELNREDWSSLLTKMVQPLKETYAMTKKRSFYKLGGPIGTSATPKKPKMEEEMPIISQTLEKKRKRALVKKGASIPVELDRQIVMDMHASSVAPAADSK